MTRRCKKIRERHFVEEASRLLKKTWILRAERENPDFVIAEGEHMFGLEVSDVFVGSQNRAGAVMKKMESDRQCLINTLQSEYEAVHNVPLHVRFVGSISTKSVSGVVSKLVEEDFVSKPIRHHVRIKFGDGLCAYVTKALRNDWSSVNDNIGFVDRNPERIITNAIQEKAKKLARYRGTKETSAQTSAYYSSRTASTTVAN